MAKPSRAALLEFLDYLSKKGLMNRATVSARKAAAHRVLGILEEAEAEDISQLDLDEVMNRFHNLEGAKFTPESLSTYRSRLKSAIDDFLRYQRDPLNFRPTAQASGRRPTERQRVPVAKPESTSAAHGPSRAVEAPPASVHILPIPIRSDLTVKIQGLPYDLTAQEANRIANVIKAMAIPD